MAKKSRDELLDEPLQGVTTQEAMIGPQGLLKALTGALLKRALYSSALRHIYAAEYEPAARKQLEVFEEQ